MAASILSADKAAILEQMERILASTVFRNSKRHSSLLRYLVEKTLEGEAHHLKERILGVEVFGRAADYDNYSDPVVRISAGEIRKRIAQYYHEPGREKEIRIELPLGSYVPEFLEPSLSAELPPAATKPDSTIIPPSAVDRKTWAAPTSLIVVIFLCSCILVAGFSGWHPWVRNTPFDQFWKPFVTSAAPITICAGRTMIQWTESQNGSSDGRLPLVAWSTALALVKVSNLLETAGAQYQSRRDDKVTFEEFRNGPAVVIGAQNNVWTTRFMENLRFVFQDDGNLRYIQDKNNLSSRAWTSPEPLLSRTADYAIITRLLASQSGQPTVLLGGVGGTGTEAAAEFVTRRSSIEAMSRNAPVGWERKNLQIIIEIPVINGNSGPPKIVALHVW